MRATLCASAALRPLVPLRAPSVFPSVLPSVLPTHGRRLPPPPPRRHSHTHTRSPTVRVGERAAGAAAEARRGD